jgi:3-oxoacyl-[acyl-carrier-protein] synthase-3
MSVPAGVMANEPIAARLGVTDSWIRDRTGVRERRIARDGEGLTALAAQAGARALARADLDAGDLDLVLVATVTQDELMPNAAPLVAGELGAARAGALDVGSACAGFLPALALAVGQIEAGRAANALVIGADLMSRITDPDDRSTAALFGDGAGAVVLTATPAPGRIGPIVLGADASQAGLVVARRDEGVMRMEGHDTFKHAVARLVEVTGEALALAGLELVDVDLFVYHQANGRIIDAVGQRLGLAPERVARCVDRFANTSAGSIPIALAVAEEEGRLRQGERVLLASFGAGLTWGGALVEWSCDGA